MTFLYYLCFFCNNIFIYVGLGTQPIAVTPAEELQEPEELIEEPIVDEGYADVADAELEQEIQQEPGNVILLSF